MNYIQQLKAKVEKQDAALKAVADAVNHAKVHLNSDKFKGVESDGSRKDWIATADVFSILQGIADATTVD